jgi:hypothetical protein
MLIVYDPLCFNATNLFVHYALFTRMQCLIAEGFEHILGDFIVHFLPCTVIL